MQQLKFVVVIVSIAVLITFFYLSSRRMKPTPDPTNWKEPELTGEFIELTKSYEHLDLQKISLEELSEIAKRFTTKKIGIPHDVVEAIHEKIKTLSKPVRLNNFPEPSEKYDSTAEFHGRMVELLIDEDSSLRSYEKRELLIYNYACVPSSSAGMNFYLIYWRNNLVSSSIHYSYLE